MIARARPAPVDVHEAIEILSPMVSGDCRLREEEKEAIALVINLLSRDRPSTRWVVPVGE